MGEAHQCVGVGYIKRIAHEHHAERRIQPLDAGRVILHHTVIIGVKQKRNPVEARHSDANHGPWCAA